MDDQVKIFDTTLRDGEQSPGASMTKNEKLRIALLLAQLKVDVIEAGFAYSSPEDFESIQQIAEKVKGPTICSLARAKKEDIDAAYDAIKAAEKKRIHTFIATSNIHLEHKLKMTKEQVLERLIEMVKYAHSKCEDVEFSPEDAFRTDHDFLFKVIEAAIDAGASTINIPDTVGYATPVEFGSLIGDIFKNVPNIGNATISVHCHNDLGLAVANSLEAVKNGARQVECTINGIGERAGNAALEEVVMSLRTRKDYYGVETGVNTKCIKAASELVSDTIGFLVQPNKAIVGRNAFAHEAGIHQHGVIKEKTTYEIMQPEDIGITDHKNLVLGKHSGRHAIQSRLQELDIEVSSEELDAIFKRFKELTRTKKTIYNADLLALVGEEMQLSQQLYELKDLKVESTFEGVATSTVVIIDREGNELSGSKEAPGPVDASYGVIDELLDVKPKLLRYYLDAVTEGIDAMAKCNVQIDVDGKQFSGRGVDYDIIMASAKAYINAINESLLSTKQ